MSLLSSLSLVILLSLILGSLFKKINLPALIIMMFIGIVFGPYVLNLISPSLINISGDIRQVCLIIILCRAGLSIDIDGLRKNGLSSILLCFLPAIFEILGYLVLGVTILKLSALESLLLGSVMSAVSPAVIVPRMLTLKEKGYGIKKGVPDVIMAGASLDDIIVIVLFTSFLATFNNSMASINILWQLPSSIVLSILIGCILGLILHKIFVWFNTSDEINLLVILSVSFLYVAIEKLLKQYLPFASMLSVITMCIIIMLLDRNKAKVLSKKFSKLWIIGEIMLFSLVGMEVNIHIIFNNIGINILIVFSALVIRMIGVLLCLVKSKFNIKERLFIMFSYIPKATVQAALGGIPLSVGLSVGNIILTFAVLSIVITAPLGAILMDFSYKKLLNKDDVNI